MLLSDEKVTEWFDSAVFKLETWNLLTYLLADNGVHWSWILQFAINKKNLRMRSHHFSYFPCAKNC